MRPAPLLTVALLTAAGLAIRLPFAHQGLFADELSTYWIVTGGGLRHVIATVGTDAEITPPLFFALSWLGAQLGHASELIRWPSIVAGAATMPLVYLVGRRTVGTRPALLATAFTAFSPFMIYYSGEARGYALMVALVLVSTYALLRASDGGGTPWWVVYAACACAAVYTHYTSVFALAGQLGWLLWARPAARKPALLASVGAALVFAPWIPWLRGDLNSPTTDILAALQPLTAGNVVNWTAHWALGYPYSLRDTGLDSVPGAPGLVLLALGTAVAAGGLSARLVGRERWRPRPAPEILLPPVVLVCVFLGELAASLAGGGIFGTRNLAVAWPMLALCFATAICAAGRRAATVAAALAVAGFVVAGVRMFDPDLGRPSSADITAFIERTTKPGEIVVDGASFSPAGVPTAVDFRLNGSREVMHVGRDRVQYDPFRILALAKPVDQVVREAAAASKGRRFMLLMAEGTVAVQPALDAVPPSFRPVAERHFRGVVPAVGIVFEDQTASGA